MARKPRDNILKLAAQADSPERAAKILQKIPLISPGPPLDGGPQPLRHWSALSEWARLMIIERWISLEIRKLMKLRPAWHEVADRGTSRD